MAYGDQLPVEYDIKIFTPAITVPKLIPILIKNYFPSPYYNFYAPSIISIAVLRTL
jgi:hypothetical protein